MAGRGSQIPPIFPVVSGERGQRESIHAVGSPPKPAIHAPGKAKSEDADATSLPKQNVFRSSRIQDVRRTHQRIRGRPIQVARFPAGWRRRFSQSPQTARRPKLHALFFQFTEVAPRVIKGNGYTCGHRATGAVANFRLLGQVARFGRSPAFRDVSVQKKKRPCRCVAGFKGDSRALADHRRNARRGFCVHCGRAARPIGHSRMAEARNPGRVPSTLRP